MFHVFKESDVYDGHPYNGYTSEYKDAEYPTLEEAINTLKKFQEINSGVGWCIFDSDTKQLVYGYNLFV